MVTVVLDEFCIILLELMWVVLGLVGQKFTAICKTDASPLITLLF